MALKTIDDVEVKGKRVLVRADLNVPLREGRVADPTRIVATVPTVKALVARGARVVLCSHLGDPKGARVAELSLRPVAAELAGLLAMDVAFAEDCGGPRSQEEVARLPEGGVLLLENTRFWPGEKENDAAFAASLAALADVFVDDAFGTAHRKHASNYGVAALVKPAVAGYLLAREVEYLDRILESPPRPLVLVLGGAKLSTKLSVVTNMADKVDRFLIGGGMAYTFLKAQGVQVGKSLVEDDFLSAAAEVLKTAGGKVLLPQDHVVARGPEDVAGAKVTEGQAIPPELSGLDVGPRTVAAFAAALRGAGAVFWNGPMGVFEVDAFAAGTQGVAEAIAASGAVTVVGGGESVQAVHKFGLQDKFTHISTGGGASLKYLEGKPLAAIEALDRK